MIVIDIETSGRYTEKHGIWQIGAVDFYNPSNTFLEEARIDEEDEVEEGAIKVHGKSEEYLRDEKKQLQKSLLQNFFNWCKERKIKNAICQNPQFDIGFITFKARKYNLKNNYNSLNNHSPFHHRSFDLHSIAQSRYYKIYGDFLIEKDYSHMGLTNILKLCGLKDERKEHNALEDAKLTAECFSRLVSGKGLLPEYSQFSIPEEIRCCLSQ